jgi:apolipoprotein N-acyltransferase
MELGSAKAGVNTSVIVAPETVVERYPEWNEERIQYIPSYLRIAKFISGMPKADLLMGVSSSKIYSEGEKPSATARTKGELVYDVYNSAFLFKRDGTFEVYHKSILVSGVEKVPFMKYLGFLKNIIINLGGASGNLGRQEEASVFTTSDGAMIAPVICYESVFGEYLTDFVKKGAEYIVIITNDGWWKNTPGYRQHLSFARLRAIETRRSIARSANTGISCFINQRGDVLQKTVWWKEAVIRENLNANKTLTYYVKNGDFIARIAAFMTVFMLMILMSDKIRKKMRGAQPK